MQTHTKLKGSKENAMKLSSDGEKIGATYKSSQGAELNPERKSSVPNTLKAVGTSTIGPTRGWWGGGLKEYAICFTLFEP